MQGYEGDTAVRRLHGKDEEEELMILGLTRTTAELVGESPAEWQALEQIVQLEQWTSGPRTEEWWLRGLASRLKVPLRVEGVVVVRTRARNRTASEERS